MNHGLSSDYRAFSVNSIYTRLMDGFVVDIELVPGGYFHRTDDLGLTKALLRA